MKQPDIFSFYSAVRLETPEFIQLFSIPVGNHVRHANLQHSGIDLPREEKSHYYAVRIVEHGSVVNGTNTPPVLDLEHAIHLELVDRVHSVPVADLQTNPQWRGEPHFLQANSNGLVESLFQKYGDVRGITQEDLILMYCFVTTFRVLGRMSNL